MNRPHGLFLDHGLTPRSRLVSGPKPRKTGNGSRTLRCVVCPNERRAVRKAFAVYGSSPSIAFWRKTRFRDGEM